MIATLLLTLACSADAGQLVPVVVAAEEVPPLTVLREEQVELAWVPLELIAGQGVFSQADGGWGLLVDRLLPGEIVRVEHFAHPSMDHGLPAKLSEGHVAMALSFDAGHGMEPWLKPVDDVNVLVDEGRRRLLQRILVLAVNGAHRKDAVAWGAPPHRVLLDLRHDDALLLHAAVAEGEVRLEYRDPLRLDRLPEQVGP